MFMKLGEAIYLFVRHFGLIAAVILTVWLPGNLLVSSIAYFAPAPANEWGSLLAYLLVDAILGPVAIGALIHALWQIKQEEVVGYGEAMVVGIRNWGRLFVALLIANLQITLGMIAFVIPGVILALRYAVLDCVVVVEGAGSYVARGRSTYLTEGIKLQIFTMSAMFYGALMVGAAILYMSIDTAVEFGRITMPLAMVLQTCADCAVDVVAAILQIAVFLYYWDKRVEEMGDAPMTPDDAAVDDDCADVSTRFGEGEDDENPYRSPQV